MMNEIPPPGPVEGREAPVESRVSVPTALLEQARGLGVDAAGAAADGIRRAVRSATAARYADEHREAIEAWNGYVAENGLPFEDILEQSP